MDLMEDENQSPTPSEGGGVLCFGQSPKAIHRLHRSRRCESVACGALRDRNEDALETRNVELDTHRGQFWNIQKMQRKVKAMRILSLVGLIFLFLSGCATVPMPQEHHFIKSNEAEIKSDGKAAVYLYRKGQFVGSAVNYHIRDGNQIIGALKSDCYFKYIAEPGEHFFWAENEKISSVTVHCNPNEEYFIEGNVSMGAWMGNPELTLVPKDVAKGRIQGLQYYKFDFTKSAPNED
jgi:hypothetical protein